MKSNREIPEEMPSCSNLARSFFVQRKLVLRLVSPHDPQRPTAANLDSQIDGSVCGNTGKTPAMHGEAWGHRQGAAWVSVPMPSPFVPMPALLVGRLPVLHSSPRDIAGLPVALCVSVAAPQGRLKRKRGG